MKTTLVLGNVSHQEDKLRILRVLSAINGIWNAKIDIERATLSLQFASHNVLETVRIKLRDAGYPIAKEMSLT